MKLDKQMIAADTAEQAEDIARSQAQHNGFDVINVEVLEGNNGMWSVQVEAHDTPLAPSTAPS
jgi:hypothetical protein